MYIKRSGFNIDKIRDRCKFKRPPRLKCLRQLSTLHTLTLVACQRRRLKKPFRCMQLYTRSARTRHPTRTCRAHSSIEERGVRGRTGRGGGLVDRKLSLGKPSGESRRRASYTKGEGGLNCCQRLVVVSSSSSSSSSGRSLLPIRQNRWLWRYAIGLVVLR